MKLFLLLKYTGYRFVCEGCGKKYSHEYGLQAHLAKGHEDRPKIHVCTICGKSLNSGTSLKYHMWSHLSQEEINARVSVGESYPLKRDRKSSHPCRFCGKCFAKQYLKTHEKMHSSMT